MARDLLNAHLTSQPADEYTGGRPVRRLACTIVSFAFAVFPFTITLFASDPVDVASTLIGRQYVWGGAGPDAFDCSGLVQYVFARAGIDLPRRAVQQSEVGKRARGRLQRGDLVFFATDARHPTLVTHVGIYEAAGTMIDASSRFRTVRREDIGDEYWTPRYLFAMRLDGDGSGRDEPASRSEPRRPRSDPSPRAPTTARAAVRRAAEEFARRILQRSGF